MSRPVGYQSQYSEAELEEYESSLDLEYSPSTNDNERLHPVPVKSQRANGNGRNPGSKVTPIRPQVDVYPLNVISVNELLRNEYEPVKWIIPDILPEGLTLFAAAPKIGKSMVALAIALRMARRVHGGIDGDTLYLSLDDVSERRLQSRVRSLLQGKEIEDHVFIATESQSIDTGLIEQLEMWMQERPATVLIVIDVYGAVKPKRVGDDIYKNDYSALNSLRTFATKHRAAVILIHHTRKKGDDGDWINNINGSNGLAGACDTLWYLKRKRGEQEMTLCIDGREDGLASEIGLTLEDLDLPWNIDGAGSPQELNESEQKVIDVLQVIGEPLTPKQIAELSELKNTRMLIRRMFAKKLLVQTTYGKYELPSESNRVTAQSNRVTESESIVTLSEPTSQASSEARVTKNANSGNLVTLVTSADEPPRNIPIVKLPHCQHMRCIIGPNKTQLRSESMGGGLWCPIHKGYINENGKPL